MIVLRNLRKENAFKETLVPNVNTVRMKPVLYFFTRVRERWKEVSLGVDVVKECQLCTDLHSST